LNKQKLENKRLGNVHSDQKVITAALERASEKALLFHKQTGHPIYVWEYGKVIRREARDIKLK